MANIISPSFFVANINIPNSGDASIASTINWFIQKYETRFLQNALGYPLYKAYLATPSAARFQDILNGKEYTDWNGRTTKWDGLVINLSDTQKTSPIANYVYYWYTRNNITQSTGVAEVIASSENATTVSPRKKMASAWNEMRTQVIILVEFIEQNPTVYPEWDPIDKFHALKHFGFMNPIF